MEGFDLDLRDQVAAVYRDGRWICVMTMASTAARYMAEVAEAAGFETPTHDDVNNEQERGPSPLIGLAVHGTDPDPDNGFRILSLDLPSSGDFVADVLGTASAVVDLPDAIVAELDAWDRNRTALVLVPPVLSDQPVAGRQVFAGRPPSWAALEDKLAVLTVWAEAGIATAPAEVVALDDRATVVAAHERLAGSNGTVWAVDNAKGMHGGAAGTHWVSSTETAYELADRLADDHERVRIMPYLDGIPCSIHGIVLENGTVTSRPNEMLVYVDESDHRFHYCRFGNHWDPSPGDREAMVSAASAVGDTLRTMVGFRGVFSLDGVLTAEGFLPTEINPRYGMALPFTLPTADGRAINMILLDKAIIAGAIRPDPNLLQAWLVDVLDGDRRGGASFATANAVEGPRSATIVDAAGEPALIEDPAPSEEPPQFDGDALSDGIQQLATVAWMPEGASHRLSITFGDGFPVGPPAAPLAWSIARLVDEHWNVGLDNLVPALSLS